MLLGVLAGVPECGRGIDNGGLPRAAVALGHEAVVVDASTATPAAVRDVGADAWVTRFARLEAGYALSAMAESVVEVVINRGDAVRMASDQLSTLVQWRRCGLPVPLSFAVELNTVWAEVADLLGVPLVVKFVDTTGGAGVHLVTTADEFAQVLEVGRARGVRLLGQQFLGATAGQDLRLIVVGGTVVASMRRCAVTKGEWRANLQLGGRGFPVEASRSQEELAVAACATIGLDVAGVDLLDGPGGRDLLLEINPQPGRRIEGVCGIDVAAATVGLVATRLDESPSASMRSDL